jgi:hypothetical protein
VKRPTLVLLPLLAIAGCHHDDDAHRAAATPSAGSPAAAAPAEPVSRAPAPAAALAGPVEGGHRVIVRLVGRTKTMTVMSTSKGPTYSVVGAKGELLLTQGTLDDLRRQHPDLYRQVRQGLVSTHGDAAAVPADADDFEHYLDYRLIGTTR